nr:GGDEF domain-containing protein [Lachnotalea sp. AF33-28]
MQLLYIDSLTRVYNRRYYDEHFRGADDVQAMVVIDMDNFKHINDKYGHDVGDIVLQNIAQTILSCVRKTDAVIRYGGDEFVIIFFNIPADIFEKKLEKIRFSIDCITIDDYPELHMSVSIGGAYGIGTPKKLFKLADNMMYQSKNTKNKVSICFLDEKECITDNV